MAIRCEWPNCVLNEENSRTIHHNPPGRSKNRQALDFASENIQLLVLQTDLFSVSLGAHGKEECYQGYDSRKCLTQKKRVQEKLNRLYVAEEEALAEKLRDYEPELIQEAIRSLRETNRAKEKYKDAECYSAPLHDGMSFKDSGVLADACRVEWREKTIEEYSAKLTGRSSIPSADIGR